ncbi:MAG: DUF512 domain-containing protein [Lachnospiraceae bacterium]|nr:DUF512 domain-containing protein [Lachnospiraceae bacterium]MBQ4069020.1 DUF512 domain-containing protein [Lachnospiraceae bacterium]
MEQKGHLIIEVLKNSIAEELDIEKGDVLLAINDTEIEDIFDYQYLMEDEYVEILIRKQDGEEWILEVDKDVDEDLGVKFENGLMSEYRSCRNKCIFCFIDQMPKGMRETLYFKDDDSRLSFLQGNYITLTNMSDKDIDRIIRYNLGPINISVQSTNPELRCKMLNNRFAGEALDKIKTLYNAGIEMNGQIVLCKGVNDGEELKRSIEDLMQYLPFMKSVSVVPAGLTKYRDGLYPLEPFTKEEAIDVINMIESYQKDCFEKFGLHFIHASDEWYILAEKDFPAEDSYDGYLQLENGVGMMRLLNEEFTEAINNMDDIPVKERSVSIVTGKLAYPMIKKLSEDVMKKYPQIKANVYSITNDFFGEMITVSGLITGGDLIAQLKDKELGKMLLLPSNMLRSGEMVFLDDVTVNDVEKALQVKINIVESSGKDFLDAVINEDYHSSRNNENFVYIDAYDN